MKDMCDKTLDRPREALFIFTGMFLLSFLLIPLIGVSFFPRSDAGQFVINVKAPTGTRIEVTNDYIKQVEDIVRQVVKPDGSQYSRFQHRRDAGPVRPVYSKLRHAHRIRAGRPEGRSQHE